MKIRARKHLVKQAFREPVYRVGDGRPMYYVLENKTPRPAGLEEGMRFFSGKERLLWRTNMRGPTVFVSTVFLVIDHGWDGRPVLFETMCFGAGPEMSERYYTWEAARKGHKRHVAELRQALKFVEKVTTPVPLPLEGDQE